MRFIHTADWQLGKPFGRFEPDVRAALIEARYDAIDAVGRLAAENNAKHVIVAGDVFDTEGPEDRVIVQAVSRMSRHLCHWWLLPGNHDYARNGGLWDRVRAKGAQNITILAEAVPHEFESGIWMLPAPLEHRHQLEDPTELSTLWRPRRHFTYRGCARDYPGFRIARGNEKNQIAPDRARRSSLDYLALGDWHGALQVDARTWYSGTAETDRFQRDEPGQVLLVDVEPGGEPTVERNRTGRFQWLIREWSVNDATNFTSECDRLVEDIEPAGTLLQLSLAGIIGLADRVAILGKLENELSQHV